MLESMKKGVYTGIGLALMTRDKIEEVARDMANNSDMSEDEGREFIDDLMDRTEKTRKDIEDRVNKMVKETVERLKMATREDVEKLENRIETLNARIDILQSSVVALEEKAAAQNQSGD